MWTDIDYMQNVGIGVVARYAVYIIVNLFVVRIITLTCSITVQGLHCGLEEFPPRSDAKVHLRVT